LVFLLGSAEVSHAAKNDCVVPLKKLIEPQSLVHLRPGILFKNPIVDFDFPDPGFLKASDGYYYAYGTQSVVNGKFEHIQLIRSKDLVSWQRLPDALPELPAWGNKKPNTWAPDVAQRGGKYLMYYTAEHNETKTMALAVAVSDSPAGPFKDSGKPLSIGTGFEDIDPHYFEDPDTKRIYLYWGSGFKPLKGRELDGDGLKFKEGSLSSDLVFPRTDLPDGYERLQEAPWVIKRNGWYYMFYSGDDCFDLYEVRVARAKSPLGPFETFGQSTGKTSSAILRAGGQWKAPGHNAIFTDAAGQDWILYHGIDTNAEINPGQPGTRRRPLLMDPITYVDGWPRVQDDVPSTGLIKKPIVQF